MLKKLLILVRSRKETFILVAISFVLLICAIIVGISDNIPGLILSYLATTVLVIALIYTWQEVKKFLILLGASFVGFFAFAFLHNAFYGLVMMTSHIPVLSHLL